MGRLLLPPLLFASIACASCTGGGSGSSGSSTAQAEAPPTAPVRPVLVARPVAHPFPRIVVLHGTLEPRESVQIAARVEGPLTSVRADLGDHARSGEALALISSSEFRAQLAEANAQLTQARSDFARLDGVDRPEVVSRQEVEQARTKVTVAEAARTVAAQNLRDARVVAPFAGTVSRRYVAPGAFVRVGDPLFDFVADGPMRLVLEVPERFVNDVVAGTKVQVRPEGQGGEGFEAEVVRIAPAIEATTRTFRVEASVESHEGALRPGMFVLGTITLGMADDAFALPRPAVYSVLGQDRVTLVADGVAAFRDVELVGERDGQAYVRGVTADDVVVARGAASLSPGMAVRPEAASAPAAEGER
jgi:membrane fusion protein (multidrug efflux system)